MSERLNPSETESDHSYFLIEKIPNETGELAVGEVKKVAANRPEILLDQIRWNSEDSRVQELVVQRDDRATVLVAERDEAGDWQLTHITSDLLKLLQTNIGKRQWSQHWLFKTDQPRRKRATDV